MVAIGFVVLLALAVARPVGQYMQYRHGCIVCRGQTKGLLDAIGMYAADYGGLLPVAGWQPGAAWHRVGHHGQENHSNTRNLFLLLSLRYVDSSLRFVCCGAEREDAPQFDLAGHPEYRDFPSRRHVTYSYPVFAAQRVKLDTWGERPLLADMSPHFHSLCEGRATRVEICLDSARHRNSGNHAGRGQNVGWGDGRVEYRRRPRWGRHRDDLYVQEDVTVYNGHERPSEPNDVFLF
jgi:hypothetical protein